MNEPKVLRLGDQVPVMNAGGALIGMATVKASGNLDGPPVITLNAPTPPVVPTGGLPDFDD